MGTLIATLPPVLVGLEQYHIEKLASITHTVAGFYSLLLYRITIEAILKFNIR